MGLATKTAVILAAGIGSRLHDVFPGRPKGFIPIGEESLIERSVRLLKANGVARIVIVSGFQADFYKRFASARPGVEIVENPLYATTGSMASLACALRMVDSDFLLLESDLLYESRGLTAILEDGRSDVILASGPTGATDEVWVEGVDGCMRSLSKDRAALGNIIGEFAGITRVSRPLAELMLGMWEDPVQRHTHPRMEYETHGLVMAAESRKIGVCCVPDLLWGEIDCAFHYRRVQEEVWPACKRKEGMI